MNRRIYLYLQAFCLFIAFSCRKPVDVVAPLISSVNLSSHQLSEFDTLYVSGRITDEQQLKWIEIHLSYIDPNNNRGVFVHSVPISGNEVDFEVPVVLDFPDLLSGNYELKIMANDGVNTSFFFDKVFIEAQPKRLRGFFYVDTQNKIIKLDTALVSKPLTGALPGMSFFEHNPRRSELLLVNSALLEAVDDYDASTRWVVVPSNSEVPITSSYFMPSTRFIYIGLSNGRTRAYNEKGELQLGSIQSPDGSIPKLLCTSNDFLLVYAENQQGIGRLDQFWRLTGSFRQTIPITGKVKSMVHLSANKVLMLTEKLGSTSLYELSLDSQGLIELGTDLNVEEATIVSTDGSVIVLRGVGGIYLFNKNMRSAVILLSETNLGAICYEQLSGSLVFSAANGLYSIRPVSGSGKILITTLNTKCQYLQPVYNK